MPITISIPEKNDLWDSEKQEFYTIKACELKLEHSLVSISKWEAKYHKPFISKETKTNEETLDYIRYMTITQNVDPKVYSILTKENILEINEYISDPHTATTFFSWDSNDKGNTPMNSSVITAERIYYWMLAFNIPMECQKWHFNNLLTLIRICNNEQGQNRKMDKNTAIKNYAALNKARKAKYHTRG